MNNFTIMNTWFTKKPMHLATWKHPATKQSFMIDYIVMRAGQRKLCTDVQVMRGATCWSDHHMIRGKVRIKLSLPKKSRATALPIAVHTFSDPDQRSTYREKLDESLSEQPHSPGNSAEEGWNTLKECNSGGSGRSREEKATRLVLRWGRHPAPAAECQTTCPQPSPASQQHR